jgi:predicted Fe-Mo cluster-binding NifX family protein
MKVAIPTEGKKGMDEQVSGHFGRALTYTIVDTESGAVEIVENTSDHMGGRGKPPELLAARGVQLVLCANLGPSALQLLCARGIEAYIGASGTVKDALVLYNEKKLAAASEESSCKDGRHHHGEGRHEHHGHHGCCGQHHGH